MSKPTLAELLIRPREMIVDETTVSDGPLKGAILRSRIFGVRVTEEEWEEMRKDDVMMRALGYTVERKETP